MTQEQVGNPILSVIIPVYNTESFLEKALDSILQQDYSNFEIIAINDGSQDQSGSILDLYKQKDARVQVYHRKNSGLSATRNFGLEKSSGTFIYFFDSDDVLMPGALKHLMWNLKNSGSEVVAFSGRYIDEKGSVIQMKKSLQKIEVAEPVSGEELILRMIKSETYSPVVSMYIYRKSFLQKNRVLFLEGYIHEDEFYTIQVLCMADRALSVSNVFYEHRIRKGSIMKKKPGMKNVEGWSAAVSQMLTFIDRYPLRQATKKKVLNRAQQLTHNILRIINSLQKEEKLPISVYDYFSKVELEKLGFDVQLRCKHPGLFRVYNKLKKVASMK